MKSSFLHLPFRLRPSKNLFYVLFLSINIFYAGCSDEPPVITPPAFNLTEAEKSYFKEVALFSEFDPSINFIKKWEKDVLYYVSGENNPTLRTELDKLVAELNDLVGDAIEIQEVSDSNASNVIVYFGTKEGYVQIAPYASNLVNSNWGLFFIYWDSQKSIQRANMYVDTERTTNIQFAKHLLREEFTQLLGLMNDVDDYPESIFYKNYSTTNQFAEVDKKLIQTLYDSRIHTGMLENEVDSVLNN